MRASPERQPRDGKAACLIALPSALAGGNASRSGPNISPSVNVGRQVGWEWRGLAVWSPSGCRLVCSLRQTAQDAGSTPRMPLSVHQPLIPSGPGAMPLPLESGISALTWGVGGYSLLLTETASSGQVMYGGLLSDAVHWRTWRPVWSSAVST